ncbi:UNKNOWN [Stylonychia lemnae]|uniref:Uncharacterized protein n=1 Tax=Stylonychia lemnae TaxID=5949 RepID=A0A078ANR9_STYLE|nr:UNKNOWN [Stylonychia lemnae]|eukprot:CDW82952.1 UNKNOWN [Stylonychia lemnae]
MESMPRKKRDPKYYRCSLCNRLAARKFKPLDIHAAAEQQKYYKNLQQYQQSRDFRRIHEHIAQTEELLCHKCKRPYYAQKYLDTKQMFRRCEALLLTILKIIKNYGKYYKVEDDNENMKQVNLIESHYLPKVKEITAQPFIEVKDFKVIVEIYLAYHNVRLEILRHIMPKVEEDDAKNPKKIEQKEKQRLIDEDRKMRYKFQFKMADSTKMARVEKKADSRLEVYRRQSQKFIIKYRETVEFNKTQYYHNMPQDFKRKEMFCLKLGSKLGNRFYDWDPGNPQSRWIKHYKESQNCPIDEVFQLLVFNGYLYMFTRYGIMIYSVFDMINPAKLIKFQEVDNKDGTNLYHDYFDRAVKCHLTKQVIVVFEQCIWLLDGLNFSGPFFHKMTIKFFDFKVWIINKSTFVILVHASGNVLEITVFKMKDGKIVSSSPFTTEELQKLNSVHPHTGALRGQVKVNYIGNKKFTFHYKKRTIYFKFNFKNHTFKEYHKYQNHNQQWNVPFMDLFHYSNEAIIDNCISLNRWKLKMKDRKKQMLKISTLINFDHKPASLQQKYCPHLKYEKYPLIGVCDTFEYVVHNMMNNEMVMLMDKRDVRCTQRNRHKWQAFNKNLQFCRINLGSSNRNSSRNMYAMVSLRNPNQVLIMY